MGAANISPNSPIKIKKHVRCPGNRKMLKSFKKMPDNVIRMTNEFRTSRFCGRCIEPFALETLGDRIKVCEWCTPDQDDWPDGLELPEKIVTMKSKRMLQSERQEMREQIIENPNRAGDGFVSKVICYRKNWQQNAANDMDVNDVQRPGNIHDEYATDFTEDYVPEDFFDRPNESFLKTVWQRDIAAAKLILYRGKFVIESELMFEHLNESKID